MCLMFSTVGTGVTPSNPYKPSKPKIGFIEKELLHICQTWSQH